MSQNRPIRSVHRSDEWTAEKIAEHAIPLKKDFYSLHRSHISGLGIQYKFRITNERFWNTNEQDCK